MFGSGEREPAPNFFPSWTSQGAQNQNISGFLGNGARHCWHIPRDVAAADGAGGCDAGDPGRRPSATRWPLVRGFKCVCPEKAIEMGLCMFMSGKSTKLGSTHFVLLVQKLRCFNRDDDDQPVVSGFPSYLTSPDFVIFNPRSLRSTQLLCNQACSYRMGQNHQSATLIAGTESHWDGTGPQVLGSIDCIQLLESGCFHWLDVRIPTSQNWNTSRCAKNSLWLNNLKANKKTPLVCWLGSMGTSLLYINPRQRPPCPTCLVIIGQLFFTGINLGGSSQLIWRSVSLLHPGSSRTKP